MTLLDVLRLYPGGLAKLSADCGIALHTLYRIGHASHRKPPMRTLHAVAAGLRGKNLGGERYDFERLLKLWRAEPRTEPVS